jgi:multidrug efflux pump subunit AcrA (membrane-fusion protein)
VVLKGLPARVILSAYRAKVVPPLEGKVINVSADSFTDQQNGASYFLARIRINKDELKQLEKVRLYPGMPTEAYIITGSRTFFQYLFDPITVSMRRALREE